MWNLRQNLETSGHQGKYKSHTSVGRKFAPVEGLSHDLVCTGSIYHVHFAWQVWHGQLSPRFKFNKLKSFSGVEIDQDHVDKRILGGKGFAVGRLKRHNFCPASVYYDLERGYGSAKSLYEQEKEEGAVITLEEVKSFMKKQPNKQIKGYQNYNSYLVPFARAEFQIDIMDMNKFKQEGEERYALIVIDAFSRYAYIHPMENKNSEDVLKALKEAFKVMGEPIEIFSDEDTAFLSVVHKVFRWIRYSAKNNKNPCQYC